ncbi:hypothetical protein N7535_006957 [Penicillium sp. DV-2018c]|nr:hypothetical protein N7535_006957 [Penicillium sp. DV-2018c]
MLVRSAFRAQLSASKLSPSKITCRLFSGSFPVLSKGHNGPHSEVKPVDPRWLATTKQRIGKCMMFGMNPAQIEEGGKISQQLAEEWRELIAGSEGFLTDRKRRSLFRHNVVWGEQHRVFRIFKSTKANMELGPLGHVNNVTYVRYAETARVNWTRNIGTYIDPANKKQWNSMPMLSPDKVTIYHKLVPDSPEHLASQSSFRFEVLILSEAHQRPAARCFEENVIYDYTKNSKSAEFPPWIMEQFKIIWELQEQEKVKCARRIADIENRVRALELGSWDAVGAVEDMGSAAQ